MDLHVEPVIMKGRKIAHRYADRVLKPRCEVFRQKYGRLPKLLTIVIGKDPASESYLKLKEKVFRKLCLEFETSRLDLEVTEQELIDLIKKKNRDSLIDGIIVNQPLPHQMNLDRVIESIEATKDVEGLTPENVYAWARDVPNLVPCTALGVMVLLQGYGIHLEGKHAVVIGRSLIVGKPLACLLLKENATVTMCHSKSRPLEKYTKKADVLIAAVGKAHLIKSEMVKKGAVVIDVGVNIDENGKLVGDVDYDNVKPSTSYITPVPGGTGPMTVMMLVNNLLLAFERQQSRDDQDKQECLSRYYGDLLEQKFYCD